MRRILGKYPDNDAEILTYFEELEGDLTKRFRREMRRAIRRYLISDSLKFKIENFGTRFVNVKLEMGNGNLRDALLYAPFGGAVLLLQLRDIFLNEGIPLLRSAFADG